MARAGKDSNLDDSLPCAPAPDATKVEQFGAGKRWLPTSHAPYFIRVRSFFSLCCFLRFFHFSLVEAIDRSHCSVRGSQSKRRFLSLRIPAEILSLIILVQGFSCFRSTKEIRFFFEGPLESKTFLEANQYFSYQFSFFVIRCWYTEHP